MEHHFNIEIASKYSLEEAIVLHALYTWIKINECNNEMIKEDHVWCYSTANGFAKYIPYMSAQKVRRILLKLEGRGLIMVGNFNKSGMNQTLWYAFSDAGIDMMEENDYHFLKLKNGVFKNEKCEYNIKEYKDKNKEKKSINIDQKKEENIKEESFLEPAEDERAIKFYAWVNENYPRIMSLDKPLTYDEFKKLREKFGEELLLDKMDNLENRRTIKKDYVSAYLSLNNWCKQNGVKPAV